MAFEESAKLINQAIKGLGTNEQALITQIIRFNNKERQQLKKVYMTNFGKPLEEELSSDLSGHLLKTFLALLTPSEDYEAICLRDAMKGLGTNELCLIHILCTKQPSELRPIKAAYKRLFERELDDDIASDVSGDLGRLLRSVASAGRSEGSQPVDLELAKNEAQELYKAGEGKFGTDKSVFIRILCSRSFAQLKAMFIEYDKISKKGIEKVVEKELHGDLEKACLAIVKSVRNRFEYYAQELHHTMAGLGTSDSHLIRLIVSRREIDLKHIKDAYQELYHKSLYYDIEKDTSGHYRTLLLSLI